MSNPTLPISQKYLNRIMLVLIIVLALAAGYYKSLYELEIRRFDWIKQQCSDNLTQCQDANPDINFGTN